MTTEIKQLDAKEAEQAAQPSCTLLFVDDEPNILSSLRRLFRPLGYRVLTAESGEQGLSILGEERIDLVISDMRMPAMSGAQFLEQVRMRSPDTVRILLTGYADVDAIVEAINKGQIYRYVAKPWEDNDIVIGVRHALERQQLEREKGRLEALTRRQNDELKELNATLEHKVRVRTEELRQAMALLEQAHDKLKKSFITSIRVFSNLIEMRESSFAGHSKRVAELARTVAQTMGLSDSEAQDVFLAGLLHDIGKIGLSDKLLTRPSLTLAGQDRLDFAKHAINGEASLMALEQLHEAAKLIRSHHERFDGLGYPDGLKGLEIPRGARILAAVNDYDAAQIGTLGTKRLSAGEALAMLIANREKRYDAAVVDTVADVVAGPKVAVKRRAEVQTISSELKPGMILARDLYNAETMLLLPKNCVLDERYIDKIREFERANQRPLTIFIQTRES
jgi:response regulator RpfG family c-di-GMP phosphodiesterase